MGIESRLWVQPSPDGSAKSLIIGQVVGNGPCALILGDNFHGINWRMLSGEPRIEKRGHRFCLSRKDPERYGVVSFDNGRAHTLEEKPQSPRSRYAVTGLYFKPQLLTTRVHLRHQSR